MDQKTIIMDDLKDNQPISEEAKEKVKFWYDRKISFTIPENMKIETFMRRVQI